MVKDLKILALPLAERLKWYVRRDEILAAEGKVVQILPPKKRALPPATDQATAGRAGVCLQSARPVELPSGAVPRATTVEDDPRLKRPAGSTGSKVCLDRASLGLTTP